MSVHLRSTVVEFASLANGESSGSEHEHLLRLNRCEWSAVCELVADEFTDAKCK